MFFVKLCQKGICELKMVRKHEHLHCLLDVRDAQVSGCCEKRLVLFNEGCCLLDCEFNYSRVFININGLFFVQTGDRLML